MQDLATEALVAEERADILVTREAPEAVLLPEEDGASLANCVIGGIGIVVEVRITGIGRDGGGRCWV